MQDVQLDYGDTRMGVELPDSATVVRFGQTYQDPPRVDPFEATRAALADPGEMPPLSDLAGPGKKIVIAFPDRVKGGTHEEAHRKVSIPLVVEELMKGGAALSDITLVCAMGLHRMNTVEEWRAYLGDRIVDQFWPDRLVNHDAEDPGLIDLGHDAMGNVVECNRLVAEADVAIAIGHCSGNPYGGFSGGHKMVATGITGWRSIASHHAPKTMHRDDWLGAAPKGRMRDQFTSIAKAMEAGIGKKVFAVDAVIGQHAEVLSVHAGSLDHVERACWPLAKKRTNVALDMPEAADVLVVGLPRNFHYGPGMGSNPILMSLALGGQLSRCWNALRPDPVLIAVSVCDGWFNPHWFPSYEPTFWDFTEFNTAEEYLASDKAREMALDPEYRYSYSNRYTYHPFHAMSMLSGGAVPSKRCQKVLMVGAKMPLLAKAMGFTPLADFNAALKEAERYVGKSPRILCTPECFSGGSAVHLHHKEVPE
jgi:nickel-dependent lactate racemase